MILNNPDFGNSYTVEPNVIIKTSLDGDTRITHNNDALRDKQTITMSALSLSQKEALQSFLLGNAGVQFVWHNHLGQTLNCVVTNTTVQFIKGGKGNCMYACTLSIEVV